MGAAERSMLAVVIESLKHWVWVLEQRHLSLTWHAKPIPAATQLALFTSLSAVPRSVINALTGGLVENSAWEEFLLFMHRTGDSWHAHALQSGAMEPHAFIN